jgi:hypothetical protein
MNLDYGWMFKLSSYPDLMAYWMDVRQNRFRDGFANYLNSREFVSLTGVGLGKEGHLSHSDASFLHAASLAETMKDKPRSVVEIACEIGDRLLGGMTSLLRDKGHIYVNRQGGYFHLVDGMEEVEVKQVKAFFIPGAKIEVKKWPNGKHFYAYVDGASVEYDGANKWSTEAVARIRAEQWAKDNNLTVE